MPTQPQLIDALSTEHLRADLKGRSVRGGALTITSQGAQFIIQSVSTVVLARLLTPADFGLVAMVTAVTSLGQAFADLGLSEATIQREKISHRQVSTLFWINVAIGLTLTLVTAALAPALAWFYREPRLRDITYVVSLTFLIGGLRVQHDALLKRQMRFTSLVIRDVASYVVAVTLTIAMAWRGAGYWAIVAFPLILNSTAMIFSWSMARWIPGPPRRDAGIGTLIAFGGNIAVSYIIYSVNYSAANVLIGARWGAGPLGLYSRAYNLLLLPVRQLAGPARSVALPAFSRIQGDPERFARYYLRTANLIMWIGAPVFGFLFVAAKPVIVVALGHQWGGAAPVFQILAISALGQLLLDSTVWVLVSRGQAGRLLKLWGTISPIMVGSFAIGLPFGIKGVALCGSLVMIGIFPWVLRYVFRGTELTLRRLGQAVLCPVSLCLTGVALSEVGLQLIGPQRVVSQLLIVTLGFAVTYSLGVLMPPIRREINALSGLLGDLRLSGQTV